MSEIKVIMEVRLRRGAMSFLFVVNVLRKSMGLPLWVPDWLIVTVVKTHAA